MENKQNNCLNCNAVIHTNFCENCGQKVSTKRFSINQLIASDFLIALFDIEKGFMYTLKSLFVRPGHFVREYIEGKRVTYFHFLTFLFIILGVYVFLDQLSTIKISQLLPSSEKENDFIQSYEKFGKEYPKLLVLISIPLTSIVSYFWFKKPKYNFAEHIILNVFRSSGETTIAIFFISLTIFYTNTEVLKYVYSLLTILLATYSIWFYFQYFSKSYNNKWKFFFRVLFSYVTLQLFIGLTIALVMGIIKGYKSATVESLGSIF